MLACGRARLWLAGPGLEEADVDRFTRMIRLVTGLGMVAAGTSLAAPAGLEIHRWWQAESTVSPALPAGGFAPAAGPQPSVSAAQHPGTDSTAPVGWSLPGRAAEGGDAAGPVTLNPDYVLPPPPGPLPPVAVPPANGHAALATAYRSTLEVPPPPLLDGQQPPPLAPGWSGRQPDAGQRPAGPTPQAMVYVIRDGDDLTGIASRFYGHPAAAAAIWEANRGLVPDPGILPIGATILLPHPDAVAGLTPTGQRAPTIEPAGFSGRVRGFGQMSP